MVEVFTTGADKVALALAQSSNDPDGWVTFGEFIAEEDMYIIGCQHNVGGGPGPSQGTCVVARTGVASLAETAERHHGDEVGYMFKFYTVSGHATLDGGLFPTVMLPDGEYFYIEKGERFYAHGKIYHGASGGAYDLAQAVLIYYTKKKP